MSFIAFEKAFQNHVVNEACWNIPSSVRMSIIGSINELRLTELSDTQKSRALYNALQDILNQQPNSELETKQLISLKCFIRKHYGLTEPVKQAILCDVQHINAQALIAA